MTQTDTFNLRLQSWYREHRGWLGYLIIFSLAFVMIAYQQLQPILADPDSFFHAKMAVLIRDGQFSRAFSALPFTTLATAFADQHFLYHLALVPFVSVMDPLVGLKLATTVFGAVFALTFYWFLRREAVPWAFVTTIVLLLVNPFMFRMNLAKTSSLSLTVLLVGLAAAFAYRPKLLGLVAFIFVWLHGGFPLLTVCVLTYAVVSSVHRRFVRHEDGNRLLGRIRALLGRSFRQQRTRRLNASIIIAVLAGTVLGLVLNPFFPENLNFYINQFFRIGVVNYQKTIGVGGEWYPYKFIDLIANTILVSIPLVVGLVLFFATIKRQTARSITLFFLWLFFFLLTLKSRRYIEYEVPFGLLFAAVSLRDALARIRWRKLWQTVRQDYLRNWLPRIGSGLFVAYVAVVLPGVVIRDQLSMRKDLANGFRLNLFQEEMSWIKDQARPEAVIFHSDWDEFPALFYWGSDQRYIAGLDPTFLYLADKDRYWQWVNVTLGKEQGDLYQIVHGTFNADYLFIERDHGAMLNLIRTEDRLSLVHEGPDAYIYHVD